MFKTLKIAGLSALIAIGTLAAIPATAQADGLYLNFGGNGNARVGVYVGDNAPRWNRHDRRDNRWERRHDRRGCSVERALNKAERIGVRRARVVNVNRNIIKVRGHKRGHRVNVVFARSPNCPIIR